MNSGFIQFVYCIIFLIVFSIHSNNKMSFVRKFFTAGLPILSTMSPIQQSRNLFRLVTIGGLVMSMAPTPAQAARMEGNSSNNNDKNSKKPSSTASDFEDLLASQLGENGSLNGLKKFFESGIPGQFGYGFLMGYSSGFCLKKVSRVAAFLLGSSFILIQSLSYTGLIKVDYEGVQDKIEVSY